MPSPSRYVLAPDIEAGPRCRRDTEALARYREALYHESVLAPRRAQQIASDTGRQPQNELLEELLGRPK